MVDVSQHPCTRALLCDWWVLHSNDWMRISTKLRGRTEPRRWRQDLQIASAAFL